LSGGQPPSSLSYLPLGGILDDPNKPSEVNPVFGFELYTFSKDLKQSFHFELGNS
jgi:hypothetical protein